MANAVQDPPAQPKPDAPRSAQEIRADLDKRARADAKRGRFVRPGVYLRNERGGRFRLLQGPHTGKGPAGCECDGCANPKGEHLYQAFNPRLHGSRDGYSNDVIDSEQDLCARFNVPGGAPKYERIDDEGRGRGPVPEMPLERLNYQQLLALAEEENVDLKGESNKAKILDAIRKARRQ